MAMSDARVTCLIAGGGPAGMMAGFLLARAGVDVLVLEKHADFLRDFRGDTIHPSTLDVMHDLDLLDELLMLPHQKVETLSGRVGGEPLPLADFRHVPTHAKFMVLMPQWDFLDFLARQGARYPTFRLMMNTKAKALIEADGQVIGVRARTPDGPMTVMADLVIGADGRRSDLRDASGLTVEDLGAPMDVLWFRLSRKPGDPENTGGYIEAGRIFVMLNRGDYWQCAFVIAKGSLETLKAAGLPAVKEEIVGLAPFLHDRVGEIAAWEDLKLLTVAVDRLTRWHRPGLLFIGDAAHAMSPIGGVGINLAIQDAVAAANILAVPLRQKSVTDAHLAAVEKRRMWPTRVIQFMQTTVQKRLISRVLASRGKITPPGFLKLFQRYPVLRRLPAWLIGVGVRPEHVRSPHVFTARECEVLPGG
jgi:2-polyprenyl-6-methoxyphenol hydroxylase-like FAD-dependent oxidoreductase